MAQLKNRIEVLEKKLKPVPVYAVVTDPKRITFTIDETPYQFQSMQDFERFKSKKKPRYKAYNRNESERVKTA